MPRLFFLITLILIVISLLVMVLVDGQVDSTPVEPGPSVRASKGKVWPKPMQVRRSPWFYELRPATFQFVASGPACALLDAALSRYSRLLLREAASGRARRGRHRANKQAQQASAQARPTWWTWRADDLFAGHLNSMSVEIGQCEVWPHASMDESYELFVDDKTTVQGTAARLSARSVWGAIRGLETFLQLFTPNGDGFSLLINATRVTDAPRFPHRGLLLDTSRHFLPVADIKLELDAMAAVKMNVLHWHIVDDQSFPWQSSLFPELSEYGAFDPTKIYSPQDVRDVIEVARLRGIRVIVEFDTPGHTRSWGEGRPGLLAACHDSLGRPDGTFANIDPTKPQNLEFIQQLFGEVAATFPDAMLHLGGDEVPEYCWDSDPSVRAYMENRGMAGNYHRLQSDYLRWLSTEVHRLNRTPIVWQEAWQNGDFQPNDVVVHVWLGRAMDLLQKITQQGFRALLSESWYLDHLNVGWQTMYRIDPQGFSGHAEQLRLVQGGEACMWAEMADETNMHSRVWPRAAAVAERLWSPKTTTDIKSAAHRLEELVCRLRRRGIPASPANGPGYCPP